MVNVLISSIKNMEKTRLKVIDNIYKWFDANKKDHKIIIGETNTFYFYKEKDIIYVENTKIDYSEIDFLSLDELYYILTSITKIYE